MSNTTCRPEVREIMGNSCEKLFCGDRWESWRLCVPGRNFGS